MAPGWGVLCIWFIGLGLFDGNKLSREDISIGLVGWLGGVLFGFIPIGWLKPDPPNEPPAEDDVELLNTEFDELEKTDDVPEP